MANNGLLRTGLDQSHDQEDAFERASRIFDNIVRSHRGEEPLENKNLKQEQKADEEPIRHNYGTGRIHDRERPVSISPEKVNSSLEFLDDPEVKRQWMEEIVGYGYENPFSHSILDNVPKHRPSVNFLVTLRQEIIGTLVPDKQMQNGEIQVAIRQYRNMFSNNPLRAKELSHELSALVKEGLLEIYVEISSDGKYTYYKIPSKVKYYPRYYQCWVEHILNEDLKEKVNGTLYKRVPWSESQYYDPKFNYLLQYIPSGSQVYRNI